MSGAFHYFRIVPEYWRDRLEKIKNMGCNTVETYIPWNFHEPKKGEFLWDGMRELGITVPFVISDGPWSESGFRAGMVDGALPTGNFGSDVVGQFAAMKRYIGKDKPLMCMEFWNGWFDAWGDAEHHTTDPEKVAKELDDLLRLGHVNFYMLEGGTSFGFMSGKNNGCKTCDITSYDYDSPLTEDGQITKKYELCKEVIGRYKKIEEIPLFTKIQQKSYGKVSCTGKVDLFSVLEEILEPVTEIALEGAADRVQGYINGNHVFTAFAENIPLLKQGKTPLLYLKLKEKQQNLFSWKINRNWDKSNKKTERIRC